MSKRSDDYEEAVKTLSDMLPEVLAGAVQGENDDFPGCHVYIHRARNVIIPRMLRKARGHFAGCNPWPNGTEAMISTGQFMDADLRMFQVDNLCAGWLAAAQPQGFDYEKWFKSSHFTVMQMACSLQLATDEDFLDCLGQNVTNTAAAVVAHTEFREATGNQTYHVWDMWDSILSSCATAMFTMGSFLGRKWEEEEVLNGILQATSSEVPE